jgi:hypothetical protein
MKFGADEIQEIAAARVSVSTRSRRSSASSDSWRRCDRMSSFALVSRSREGLL